MASTIFSSSPKFIRLISHFKSQNSARMISTVSSLINNPSPCLMLPPTFNGSSADMVYNFYNLAQNKILKFNNDKLIPEQDTRIVGSSHGWLALFNERNCDLILTNPITRRHVKLPPCKTKISNHVKVIISCDPEQEECQAMMIYNGRKLAFCRPGRSPTEWTPHGALSRNNYARCYEDIVYSRRHNLFFCVTEQTNGDDFEAWDVASDPPRLRWENRDDLLPYLKYGKWLHRANDLLLAETALGLCCKHAMNLVFVEQTDQLFFLTRHIVRQITPGGSSVDDLDTDLDDDSYPYKTISFDVHKVDWVSGGEEGILSHLDGGSLDGLAMFVGLNHSFAVPANEANGLKPNSIYFTDDKGITPLKWSDRKYGVHDIGIFDYENKTISPCYYPCDIQSFKRLMPEPIWFTPSHN